MAFYNIIKVENQLLILLFLVYNFEKTLIIKVEYIYYKMANQKIYLNLNISNKNAIFYKKHKIIV